MRTRYSVEADIRGFHSSDSMNNLNEEGTNGSTDTAAGIVGTMLLLASPVAQAKRKSSNSGTVLVREWHGEAPSR